MVCKYKLLYIVASVIYFQTQCVDGSTLEEAQKAYNVFGINVSSSYGQYVDRAAGITDTQLSGSSGRWLQGMDHFRMLQVAQYEYNITAMTGGKTTLCGISSLQLLEEYRSTMSAIASKCANMQYHSYTVWLNHIRNQASNYTSIVFRSASIYLGSCAQSTNPTICYTKAITNIQRLQEEATRNLQFFEDKLYKVFYETPEFREGRACRNYLDDKLKFSNWMFIDVVKMCLSASKNPDDTMP